MKEKVVCIFYIFGSIFSPVKYRLDYFPNIFPEKNDHSDKCAEVHCDLKKTPGSLNFSSFWKITRCPELLTGRNSVSPCIMPRIIAFIAVIERTLLEGQYL